MSFFKTIPAFVVLILFAFTAPLRAADDPIITEFMAINDSSITDQDNDFSDWIEIFNPSANPLNLAGYHLTDNAGDLSKWTFPSVSLPPKSYLVVFASGKDRAVAGQELHASFRLSGSGEYLALVKPDLSIAHAYSPAYPPQSPDSTFGVGGLSLVTANTPVKVLVPPDGTLGVDWTGSPGDEPFNDAAWTSGNMGVGFQSGTASALTHQLPNVVSYWNFDEKQGATVADQVGGSTHDGTLADGADLTSGNQGFGGSGEALNANADNNTGTKGHLSAGDPTTYDFNSSFTWHARVKTAGGNGGIMNRAPLATVWNQGSKMLFLEGSRVEWDTGWVSNPNTGVTLTDNQWHQIVVTYNVAGDLLRIYVDPATSNPIAQFNGAHNVNAFDEHTHNHNGGVAHTHFRIGWGSSNFQPGEFPGLIDDVAVWTGAFPPEDVALLAQGEPILGGGPYGAAIQTEIPAGTVSVYVRIPFSVIDGSTVSDLTLRVKYDDAFIAYLNGTRVAEANAPLSPAWNSIATANRTVEDGLAYQEFDLTPVLPLLQNGNNILALHGLNASAGNSEMLVASELVATDLGGSGVFLVSPTPGTVNSEGLIPSAGPVEISTECATFISTHTVAMSTEFPGGVIRYTTDGNEPNASSPVYSAPITISASTHIRARVFAPGFAPGPIQAGTFIQLATTSNRAGIPAPDGFSSDLPVIILDNFGGGGLNPSQLKTMKMLIFEQGLSGRSSLQADPDLCLRSAFRVRGQSTSGLPKRQYRVEIRDERDQDLNASLLGLPAESDWVFAAPYIDESLIRNAMIFEMGRETGLEASRTKFCEVFINTGGGPLQASHYAGVYVVTENIKIGNNRIDIPTLKPDDDTPPDITGGYIIRHEASVAEGPLLSGWQYAEVHDPDDLTAAQLNYISDYVNSFDAALRLPNYTDPVVGYPAYIDVDSFVNLMVLNEFAREQDNYVRSAYLHKDRNGPLVNGPLWDYNLSFGISCCFNSHHTNGWQWDDGYNRGGRESGNSFSRFDWYKLLLRDPDFFQQFIDRYQELRTGMLSESEFNDRVDRHAAQVREAQERNFTIYNTLGSQTTGFQRPEFVFPTWQEHIDHIKNWAALRLAWMDNEFTFPPTLSSGDASVTPGFGLSISAPAGTIYYTLDGTDPRLPGGGIALGASIYSSAFIINENTHIVARARVGTAWSGPARAVLRTTSPSLVITELMYNPDGNGETNEYIELRNVGPAPLQLQNYSISGGVNFTFPSQLLNPGDRVLVVNDLFAFTQRYGAGLPVAGAYIGQLNNNSERIKLKGPVGETLLNFEYKDSWYPITDGFGFSLVIVDDQAPPASWNQRSNWRPSGIPGGSPGSADPAPPAFPPVVINEALTHTDPPALDTIEVHNPTGNEVDISDWYLSDDFRDPHKYRLPPGTLVPANGHLIFDETQFNTGPTSFSLSSLGDEVFLFSGNTAGDLTGYFHGFDYGAAANGVSFGRHLTSDNNEEFVAQTGNTLPGPNISPRVGPVVISEIMYNPPINTVNGLLFNNTRHEFVELQNVSNNDVQLFDPAHPENRWRISGGIDYDFPPNTLLPAGGFILLVNFNPALDPARLASFQTAYSIPPAVPIMGPYRGLLDNSGDTLRIRRPDNPVTEQGPNLGLVPQVLVERVNYDDEAPWPAAADGLGYSLNRIEPTTRYGNDPASWQGSPPTPGTQTIAGTPPIILANPQSLTAVETHSVTFNVIVAGGPFQYQWRHNGQNIPNATNSSLVIPSITASDAGRYAVVAVSPSSSATSDNATLTVLIPARISAHPQSVETLPGNNVLFSVTASSSTPISYQWRKDGSPLPGATGLSLSLLNVQEPDDGFYDVLLTDAVGTITSQPARLAVLIEPEFTLDPITQSVPAGGTLVLAVQTTGTLPMGYRWRRGGLTVKNEITFSRTSFLVVPNFQLGDTGGYTVVATNAAFFQPGRLSARAIITLAEDSDFDGMPDDWETAHGLNPTLDDAQENPDGDSMTNIEEYIAGTDPQDGDSFLKIDRITAAPAVTIEFNGLLGKSYTLEYQDDLPAAAWVKLTDVIPTADGIQNVIDPTPSATRIYRLVTPLQP